MRERSRAMSEMRSTLTGRVVDSYTNILTVKLFARAAATRTTSCATRSTSTPTRSARQLRIITLFGLTLAVMNAAHDGRHRRRWRSGSGRSGRDRGRRRRDGAAADLADRQHRRAGWRSNVTSIFENIGMVQDGMRSIAVPRQMPDRAGRRDAARRRGGAMRFEDVHFGYGTARGVLHGIDLDIAPGERVGLVGRSGAGKSTLVNLLLRFYEVGGGRILIDGQDIAGVTQESLRAHIAMVTQDTSLLHRSIRDNIRYGRPERQRGRGREAAAPRPCARVHRGPGGLARPARLRRACRRARRQAVGRPAPAHRARARDPQGRADPGARRGDLGARLARSRRRSRSSSTS